MSPHPANDANAVDSALSLASVAIVTKNDEKTRPWLWLEDAARVLHPVVRVLPPFVVRVAIATKQTRVFTLLVSSFHLLLSCGPENSVFRAVHSKRERGQLTSSPSVLLF